MNSGQFSNYQTNSFFDEMFYFDEKTRIKPHYEKVYKRLNGLSADELDAKRSQAVSSFLEHGVTFTVYDDSDGIERVFPFDLIPRVIPKAEWVVVEQGLKQRILALNLFLHDIYHQARILKEGIIPREIVETCP